MAISVTTPNLTDVDMCEAIGSWAGGIAQMAVDAGVYVQGSYSLSAWINNTTSADEYYPLPSSVDMSGGDHAYMWVFCSGAVDTQALGGYRILLYTDLSNYATYYVGGNDTHGTGWQLMCCDASATPDLETGTFVASDVNYVGVQFKTITAAILKGKEYINNCFWDAVRYGKGLTIESGATDAIALEDIYDDDNLVANKYGVIRKQSGVYYVTGTLTFGDNTGTNSIDFEDLNQIVVFTESDYFGSDFHGIEILGNPTGTTNFVMGALAGDAGISGGVMKSIGTDTPFVFDASDSDIDKFQLLGTTIQNAALVTLPSISDSDIMVRNTAFIECGEVLSGLCEITDVNFISADNRGARISDSDHNLTDCNFISCITGTNYPNAGTYTADGHVYTGCSDDIEFSDTDSVVALVINATGGANPSTYIITGDSDNTVTINNPITHTLVSVQEDSEVTYIDSDSAELYHVESVDSDGEVAYAYNYAADIPVEILITSLTYENMVIEATLGSADATIQVSQVADVNYYNP